MALCSRLKSILAGVVLLWGSIGQGVYAQEENTALNLVEVDAYLQQVTAPWATSGAEQALSMPANEAEESVRAYLYILSRFGTPLAPEERIIVDRHWAQLALILPESLQRELQQRGPEMPPDAWTFRPGSGMELLTWWRKQDPLPATPHNERLLEHLERTTFANYHYGYAERATGWDDRGETYVRYGRPSRQIEIRFDDPRLTDMLFQPGAVVNLSDLPENEFWLYGHIDQAAYYVFIRKQGHYQIGIPHDLLPNTLRFGFSSSTRGQRKATLTIHLLRAIYQQLAPLHSDFVAAYDEVMDYAYGGGSTQTVQPYVFAQTVTVKYRAEEEQNVYTRETYLPPDYTEVKREAETLPVSYRVARFMDADGTTRTEVYWAPDPGGMRPSRRNRRALRDQGYSQLDQYVMALTIVQQDSQYRDRIVNTNHFLVTDLPDQEGTIPAQQMTVRGDTGHYHLALQWNQHLPQRRRGEVVDYGPLVKRSTARQDSMQALQGAERVLEMSDIVPILIEEDGELPEAPLAQQAIYPFERVVPETQMGMYFEIYHLTFGQDDLAHYTVSYEVRRSERRGGVLRLRGGDSDRLTRAQTTSTSTSRTAQETLMVDFSAWEGTGTLEITFRITDETTGQQVARTVSFEVAN